MADFVVCLLPMGLMNLFCCSDDSQADSVSLFDPSKPPIFDSEFEGVFESREDELGCTNTDSATDFDRPTIVGKNEDAELCEANAKEPCYGLVAAHEFGVFAKTTVIAPRVPCGVPLHSGVYLTVFQDQTDAAILEDLSCFHRLFNKETCGRLSIFVHGGWRGGKHKQPWNKGLSKLSWSNTLQPSVQGGSFLSSRLLWVSVVLVACLLISVFYPGGSMLRELGQFSFKGEGMIRLMRRCSAAVCYLQGSKFDSSIRVLCVMR